MSSNNKIIDYLTEDPEIPGQRYGLITIVGPHMPQKCDVWGLKIRGITDSLDRAKALCKKIMQSDPDYDIYTVEMGKFFPLNVEPYEVSDVEYQNDQLNLLMKNYLENRELANQEYQQRKNEMMKAAVSENRNQDTDNKQHPVAVLQQVHSHKERLSKLQEEMDMLKEKLQQSTSEFDQYTTEEKATAQEELKKVLGEDVLTNTNTTTTTNTTSESSSLEERLSALRLLDAEIESVKSKLNEHSSDGDLQEKLSLLNEKRAQDVALLPNKDEVNSYINSNYGESEYSYLTNNVSMQK